MMKQRLLSLTSVLLAGVLLALLFLVVNPVTRALAGNFTQSDSTVADFSQGTLEGVEVASVGDGAVQLLALGLGGGWSNGTTIGLPPRQQHSSVYAAGRLFVFGGRTADTQYLNTVYSSRIDTATHANGDWIARASLPIALADTAAVVLGSRIYVIGGFDGVAGVNSVYRTNILPDGSLSAWVRIAGSLPEAVAGARATVIGNRIYLVGGRIDLKRTNRVWFANVDQTTGAIQNWTETTALPAPFTTGLDGHVVFSHGNRLYAGLGFSGNRTRAEMMFNIPNPDGTLGAWQNGTPYNAALTGAAGVLYANPSCGPAMYITGGAVNQFLDPQTRAEASAHFGEGANGAWVSLPPLPDARFFHTALVTDDGWLYVIDGGTRFDQSVDSVRYTRLVCPSAGNASRAPAGNYVSRVFDAGLPQPLTSATWNTTVADGGATTLVIRYRFGDNPNLSTVPWSAPVVAADGSARNTLVALNSAVARYFQYRVDLSRATDLTSTPLLNSFTLEYGQPPTAVPTITNTPTNTPIPTATATSPPPTVTPTSPPPTVTPTRTSSPTITPLSDGVDLVVQSIALQPYDTYRPVAGRVAQVAVEVKNVGDSRLPAGFQIEVDVYANKARPNDSTTSDGYAATNEALDPGESTTLLIPLVPSQEGNVTLYAWANRPRFVPETNYSDNLAGPIESCVYSQDGQTFGDVGPVSWAYGFVEFLACRGIVSGYGDDTFRPGLNTTRGQFAKMITLSAGWEIVTAGGPHFRDVALNNVFYPYIETAYNRGVISGYACGNNCQEFRWASNVTRGQLAKIITLAKNWTPVQPKSPTFRDVAPANAFYAYIETLYARGIISGYSCGNSCNDFRPGLEATRAQLAKLLFLTISQP